MRSRPRHIVSMSLVQVLLSTFNGEQYLSDLLDSLSKQTHPDVSILARDDGSSDGTTTILQRYARSGQLCWYQGRHVGIRCSFFDLLARADSKAGSFAFCDQDDVWMPDKLARAVARLEQEADGRPALYCARARLVDAHLRPIGHTLRARRGPSLANALVENIAPGCTMVLNARARDLVLRELPRGSELHDSWTYLVVSALGRVIYDDTPTVLYRQHGANAVGARHRRWQWRLKRLRTIRQDRGLRARFVGNATELARIHGADLDPSNREILDRFIHGRSGVFGALKYAVRGEVHRQETIDNLILKMLIALRHL